MALDGIMLNKLLIDIKDICPCRINKIYKISNTELLFYLKTNKDKKTLMISCHPLYNRINITKKNYSTPEEPSNFVMLLRKHLEGAIIQDVVQKDLDRWCYFVLNMRNNLGDKIEKKLYIELMGKYANVILVDENNKIIDALKRIPPFENNKRTIQQGSLFSEVEPQNKLNPFEYPIINREISLTKQLAGFSPLLSKEVEYRINNGESFTNVIEEIKKSNSLYISFKDKEEFFHCIELKHINSSKKYELHDGIDVLYYHKEEKDRIKQIAGDLFKIVKRELKHQSLKLVKLENSLEESLDCEKWKLYGDLLYTYNNIETKGKTFIELENFEDLKVIKIPLDEKLDRKSNAKKMFQKYEKLKKGKIHLEKQIEICKDEIEYFTGINQQLELINVNDAKEIIQELINGGYIKKAFKTQKKHKKEKYPSISYIEINGSKIYFGKNNIQNETLTFKIAKKHNYFFHTKEIHGSHVIVETDNLSEELIRLAANIAALYSKAKYSSSVPVDYTQVKNLKKIPGAKIGKVSINSYKTIYIDPNEEELEKYTILNLH